MTPPIRIPLHIEATPRIRVNSIDVFVTYRCGLRCNHCFLGDLLNSSLNMPLTHALGIIDSAKYFGAQEITFLGGEPTLYPHLRELIIATKAVGLEPRIVTNAQGAFRKFIEDEQMNGTRVCVSIDGACAETHDAIRGKGTYRKLLSNIEFARNHGYAMSGIISISTQNAHEASAMLELCAMMNLDYVNVHYVSSRGNAGEAAALSPAAWDRVCQDVESANKAHPSLKVRYEKTFVSTASSSTRCAVRDRTNLMFLPDGRVYSCMMFIDLPGSHSFDWDGTTLHPNQNGMTELDFVHSTEGPGCPALALANPAVVAEMKPNFCVECIYEKHEPNPLVVTAEPQ